MINEKICLRGRLFVFEGPDGVGKTSIAKMVTNELEKKNIKSKYFSFPGNLKGSLGNLIYKLHHGELKDLVHNITPISLQALHIAAHLETIETQIKPLIYEGYIVILDRYWWSTYVYGICSGINKEILTKLIEVEKSFWDTLKPETIFLIDRNIPFRDLSDQWYGLRNKYLEMPLSNLNDSNYKIINNDKILEDVVCNIVEIIETKKIVDKKHFEIISSVTPAKPTIVFDAYWKFAAERQNIFFKRFYNLSSPWTEDPILYSYKFTNAYRASDRVSQYLIKEVIYKGIQDKPEEVFFRIILFKLFNKIETWEYLKSKLGEITYKEFSFATYDNLLNKQIERKNTIYSSAYIMPSGISSFGYQKKHQNHLRLIERMMKENLPQKITKMKTMHYLFETLLSYPTIGDFLAYQFAVDINYSELTNFSEMEFVFPGPGALDGIRKCFYNLGGLNEIEIIKLVADIQHYEFDRLGINFQSLWGRDLQLIDCQNLFCEVDKYARLAYPEFSGKSGRKRIKQKFLSNQRPIEYWYPPKWNINDKIIRGEK